MQYRHIQGNVRVKGINHLVNDENFHVIEIDLVTQFPYVIRGSEGASQVVWLTADNHTQSADPNYKGPTIIQFLDAPVENWTVMTDVSRFVVRIAMWKRPG